MSERRTSVGEGIGIAGIALALAWAFQVAVGCTQAAVNREGVKSETTAPDDPQPPRRVRHVDREEAPR